jgi:mRNA interferase YafQ
MRTIERTDAFKRDFKREKSGHHRRELDTLVFTIVSLLAEDQPLPDKNRDHALGGEWRDHRECHVKPDLLLIYRKPNSEVLQLVRLGSHSELFG